MNKFLAILFSLFVTVNIGAAANTNYPSVLGTPVVPANNGYATNAIVNGVINVKHSAYGADSTGATDSSSAVQSAATAAANKRLYFPSGSYKFADIALPDGCEVVFDSGVLLTAPTPSTFSYWFRATGKTNITISGRASASGAAAMTGFCLMTNSINAQVIGITVLDLATNTSVDGGAAFSFVSSSKVRVENCTVDGAGYGVNFESTTNSIAAHNIIKNVYRDGVLFFSHSDNCTAVGNVVSSYSTGIQSGRGGIQVYASAHASVTGNTVQNAFASNPADTGAIRFRDAPNFTCVGNTVTNATTGILCNEADDYAGYNCYGTITGNAVTKTIFSGIHVAANCGRVIINGNSVTDSNTGATANTASITMNSNYGIVSANSVSNNVGNSWGIYSGATGLLVSDNKTLNVGNGGFNIPQIAIFGTNNAVFNNHMSDDRATSIGYLGIRLYTNSIATVGIQTYGNGITNFTLNGGTWKKGSAPYINEFAGAPSIGGGTFEAGSKAVDLNGKTYVCTVAGAPGTWKETIYQNYAAPAFGSVSVNDDAYAAGWNGSTNVPTKNAVYDKIESIVAAAAGTNAVLVNETIIQSPNFKDTAVTNSPQIKFTISDTTNVIAKLNALGAQTDMTIASDALAAPTSTIVRALPESGTSDELATIAAPATNGISFFYLLKRAGDALTIKHATGNIYCPGNVDAIIGGNEDGTPILFIWNTVRSIWVCSVANSQSIDVTDQGTGVKVIQPTTSSFSRNSGVTQRAITNRNLITLTSDSINGIRIGVNEQINSANLTGLNWIDSPSVKISNSSTNYQLDVVNIGGSLITNTIASDGISLPSSPTNIIFIGAESGTSDNLSYIAPPSSGTRNLILRPKSGHTITLKHGVTNIVCMNQADIALTGSGGVAYLYYDTTITNWVALSDLNTGGGGGGSAPVGTMVNSGASTANYIPKYSDATGTNIVPSTIAISDDRILLANNTPYSDITLSSDSISESSPTIGFLASETGTNDNFSTINVSGGASIRGREFTFFAKAGHTITIKNGTGNIITTTGRDIVLSGDAHSYVKIVYWGPTQYVCFTPQMPTVFQSKSANYTATSADEVILADTGSAWTLGLPAAANVTGKRMFIKKTTSDSNNLIIDPNGTENIDGASTYTLTLSKGSVIIQSDGSNWYIVGKSDSIDAGNITSGTMATARLGSGTANTSTFLRGDQSYSQIKENSISLADNTTNNVSTSNHGFAPKLDNNSAHFLDGTGAWSTPSGGGAGDNWTASGSTNSTLAGTAYADSLVITNGITTGSGTPGGITFSTDDITITNVATNVIAILGNTVGLKSEGPILPNASDGAALGSASLMWSDLFLASGGVINFNNGNYTLTHSAGALTANGAFSIGTGNALTAGTIELGAASDTTLARSSAGNVSIEGNVIYRAGGTDVAVADGGTGLSSGTSGGIPYYSGSTTIASSAALAANALVIGGGAGAAPSTTTTGTGVLTALGNTANAVNGFKTVNSLTKTAYINLQRPDYGDGAGAVPQTNTFTASGLMHYTFSGNAETNANWAVYEFDCPPDLDTSVELTARFAFLSGGTDADDYVFHLTYSQVAAGTAYATGTSISTSPIVMTVTPVTAANGDVQQSSAVTLTGWAAALTPGRPMQVRVARLQNTQDDSARDVQLVIAYGSTK